MSKKSDYTDVNYNEYQEIMKNPPSDICFPVKFYNNGAEDKKVEKKITLNQLAEAVFNLSNTVKEGFKRMDEKFALIDNQISNIDQEIKRLDKKIDDVKIELNNKIDNVKNELKSDIKRIDTRIDFIIKKNNLKDKDS